MDSVPSVKDEMLLAQPLAVQLFQIEGRGIISCAGLTSTPVYRKRGLCRGQHVIGSARHTHLRAGKGPVTVKCQLVRAEGFSFFFEKQARESRTIKVAVAYFRRGGYEQVREPIARFLGSNAANKCAFVIGLSSHYVTEPLAVERLLRLQRKFCKQVEVRYSSKRAFHLKIFLFEKESALVACVGSSNLTGGGTAGNLEANIAIEGSLESEKVLVDISRVFSELACSPRSEVLSESRWKEYANDFVRGRVSRKTHFKPTLKPTGDVGTPGAFPDMSEDDLEETEDRPERAVWKISPGKGAFQWPEYVKRTDESTNVGPIAIGWHSIGDPSDMTWNSIRNAARKNEKRPKYVADQIWRFFRLLRAHDYVVAYGKSSILDIGEILDDEVTHLPSEDPRKIYQNQRSVKWFRVDPVSLSPKQRHELQYPQDTIHLVSDQATRRLIQRVMSKSSRVPRSKHES